MLCCMVFDCSEVVTSELSACSWWQRAAFFQRTPWYYYCCWEASFCVGSWRQLVCSLEVCFPCHSPHALQWYSACCTHYCPPGWESRTIAKGTSLTLCGNCVCSLVPRPCSDGKASAYLGRESRVPELYKEWWMKQLHVSQNAGCSF